MNAQYCLNQMTRPQLMIWYAKTMKREYNERQGDIQADWSQTANLLAMIHNTAMGTKKRLKAKDAMPEFESFEEMTGKKDEKEDLFDKAEKLGLKTPSKRQV